MLIKYLGWIIDWIYGWFIEYFIDWLCNWLIDISVCSLNSVSPVKEYAVRRPPTYLIFVSNTLTSPLYNRIE